VYGIDMSKLGDFIAFRAAIELWKEKKKEQCLQDLYSKCKEMDRTGNLHTENIVQQVYSPFSTAELSNKIAELITPKGFNIPVQVIFQTIESLHQACPTNTGDWYFTGNYPTPGGNRVVNKAFLNYMEGKKYPRLLAESVVESRGVRSRGTSYIKGIDIFS
jgi:amidophosphoribosyltransferase